jgi:hypothetical protein
VLLCLPACFAPRASTHPRLLLLGPCVLLLCLLACCALSMLLLLLKGFDG